MTRSAVRRLPFRVLQKRPAAFRLEVNGQIQTGDISLAAGGTFTVTLTLEEGRNDVNLYFTDSNGRITRKTFNYVLLTNYDMVVDGNWTGADGALEDGIPVYRTVQAAVDAVPVDNSSRKVILIREGSYREHLRVDKPMISLMGKIGRRCGFIFMMQKKVRRAETWPFAARYM